MFEFGYLCGEKWFRNDFCVFVFVDQEVDDAFAEFKVEDGMIDAVHLKSLMVAKKDEEES
jgi:hypothetical protein